MNTAENTDQFRRNAKGHLVPLAQVKDIDRLRDELVSDVVTKVKELQKLMRIVKADISSEVEAFLELSAREYDTRYGGKRATSPCPVSTASTRSSARSLTAWRSTNACRWPRN